MFDKKLIITYDDVYQLGFENNEMKNLSKTDNGMKSLSFKNFIKNKFKDKLSVRNFNLKNDIIIIDNPEDLILVVFQYN